jgi:cytochrome c oxidase subunit II
VRARLVVSVLFVLLLSLLAVPAAVADGGFTPVTPESPNADGIRDSYLFVSIFVLAIFVLVEGLLIAFIVKYRRQKRARFQDGAPIHGSSRLELAWTAFPVVILFVIGAFVFWELPGIKDAPEAQAGDRLEIRVEGHQYYWQFEYPNGMIAIDHMRAPAGVPVLLEVTAPDEDVIHSWWIPALGGKIDAIPGQVNETWFQAENPGIYEGQCAELCGLEHASMTAQVEVMPRYAFNDWLNSDNKGIFGISNYVRGLGQEEWEGVCAKCHGMNGEGGIAKALAGSALLSDPQTVETIVRNGRVTRRGVMPAVGAGWTTEQIQALTNYLEENPPSGS